MYEISLLPQKYKQAIVQNAKINDIIISFTATIIILSIICVLTISVGAVMKSELNDIKNVNAQLQAEIAGLTGYSMLRDEVAAINTNMLALTDSAPSFYRVLGEITQSVPEAIKVTHIKFTYDEKSKMSICGINGSAARYEDVSSWISLLNNIDMIGEVYCSYTTNNRSGTDAQVQYELKMDILDKSASEDIIWQLKN